MAGHFVLSGEPIVTTTAPTDVRYDPYDVAINENPYPTFARLREEAPLYYNAEYDFWALSRHADVESAFVDWKTFSNSHSDILDIMQAGVEIPKGIILFEDPPVHSMHRSLMSRVFSPKKVAALEGQIREYCARTLDQLAGEKSFDLIAEYATFVPMRVIGMLLGIPEADQVSVRQRTDDMLRTEPGKRMEVTADNIGSPDLFVDYIEWRAKNPSDDLMTMLLNAEFEDEEGVKRTLTRDEVLIYCSIIAGAGNETTGRLIGWLVKVLADHPDQRRDLVENRLLLDTAIDETLRFEPTGPHIARWVARDYEAYGTTVPAGSAMLLLAGSANRDPDRYENPDVFDLHRKDAKHLTFGWGLHFCLGANLARLEAKVALDEFLNRFPTWELDPDRMRLAPTSTVRGWEELGISVG